MSSFEIPTPPFLLLFRIDLDIIKRNGEGPLTG